MRGTATAAPQWRSGEVCRDLKLRGVQVRVVMEATGHARWFERLLEELKYELWVGDPAQIRARRVRKQKNDRQDAQLLLHLLVEDRLCLAKTRSG